MPEHFDLGAELSALKMKTVEAFPFGEPANIPHWITTEPIKREEIFEGLLIKGIVGGLFAQGGVGKTFFLLNLTISAALGRPLFRSFRPARPMRVLALLGEDPDDEIHRRFKSIQHKADDIDNDLLARNLRIYSGKGAPFMRLDNGNPTVTTAFEWLKLEVEKFKPDLISIDPKSMFYGLDENSNDNNTQWINSLKDLTTNGSTVLFSHHVTKAMAGSLELNGARGGSALVDGSRFASNMRQLTDDDAKKYDIEEPWLYVEFKVTKNSYIPKLPGSIFFKFTTGGALEEVDLKASREFMLVEDLLSALNTEASKGNFYTAREIERDGVVLPDLSQRDRKEAVKLAIDTGRLSEESISGKGRPRTVLTPDKDLLADMAQSNCAEIII